MKEMLGRKNPHERLETAELKQKAFSGRGYEDIASYPYISFPYELPFTHIGTEKQLFLDNFIIDHFDGVRREIEKPEKSAKPLIRSDGLPWEEHGFAPGITGILEDPDDNKFKMWYWQPMGDAFGAGQALCYAESTDALNWTKPMSDDFLPYGKEKKTNIVMYDNCMSGLVLNHDRSKLDYKFLMVYTPMSEAHGKGMRVISRAAGSNDGVRWEVIEESLKQRHHHESRIIWDDSINEWVSYGQYSHHWHSGPRTRQIGRQTSKDFLRWSPKDVVISADWDPNIEPSREFHEMSVRKIGGTYIGITGEAYTDPIWCMREGMNWKDHFHVSLGLYVSRDGISWTRAGGPGPWVDNGGPGSPDCGFVSYTAAGALCHGGKMYIPYIATPSKQQWFNNAQAPEIAQKEEFTRQNREWDYTSAQRGGIEYMREGRAARALILREDGFAAIKPVYERGKLYTKQFIFEGNRLRVNAKCNFGYIKAELLDPEFKPYEGYDLSDCKPIHDKDDKVWHTLKWKNGADMSALRNKPVRICFDIIESSMYSFQFYHEGC